jgi:hypothetical protein
MFQNCPTPPVQKYRNLKGLPEQKIFVHAVSLKPQISVRESGAKEVLFDAKKVVNLVTLTLKMYGGATV